jgi:hypothetical protein
VEGIELGGGSKDDLGGGVEKMKVSYRQAQRLKQELKGNMFILPMACGD